MRRLLIFGCTAQTIEDLGQLPGARQHRRVAAPELNRLDAELRFGYLPLPARRDDEIG